jgi:hypothetical protein
MGAGEEVGEGAGGFGLGGGERGRERQLVDVGLDVPAGSPGELVAGGFVAVAGISLLQGVELAQRLELFGAIRNPHRFAQLGFPVGGGRGVGGELGLDDVIGVRVVDGARRCGGEQLREALPLRELRPTADVVSQVLVTGVLPRVEAGVLEGRRDAAGVHPLRPAPNDAGKDDRLTGRGDARAVRRGVVIFGFVFVVGFESGPPSERRAAARRICF